MVITIVLLFKVPETRMPFMLHRFSKSENLKMKGSNLINFANNIHNMLDSIESAINDIKNGKLVIVVDDEDRENEGDFVTAAGNVTPEVINFMSLHGRGLICAPLTEDRCIELN